MAEIIESAEQAARAELGTWVVDAEGNTWCLFQTHIMVHQLMWKAMNAPHYVALEGIAYPAGVGDMVEPDGFTCPHRRIQECGQCVRCGAVAGDTEAWRRMTFGAIPLVIEPANDGD